MAINKFFDLFLLENKQSFLVKKIPQNGWFEAEKTLQSW
jgi:hypothetical protein